MVDHTLDSDDESVGRVLSRRDILSIFGSTTLALLIGCGGSGTPTGTDATDNGSSNTSGTTGTTGGTVPCVVASPELTEGPYFVDERLNRADIRSDRMGVPLRLVVNLVQVASSGCAAIEGAMVDVWHCDALGKYSDVASEGTSGQTFLRGYLLTNASGQAEFITVYPGWYSGRAVHIHFKIRATINGQSYEFTSQFFFDETLTDAVHAQAPYSSKGTRNTRNSADGIYNQGGNKLMLALSQEGTGYVGTFDVGLVLPS